MSPMTQLTSPLDIALLRLRETDADRVERYQRNWAYYKNDQYNRPEYRAGLFRQMRSVFNLVTKVVDTDARFTMGTHLSADVPSEKGSGPVTEALQKLWADSNFQQAKYLLVRYGACCGDAFMKVHDNRPWERNLDPDPAVPVKLIVLPPDMVTPAYDPNDRTRMVACKLEYLYLTKIYKEIWQEDRVEFYDPEDPERIEAVFPNPLGQIPVVHIQNLDVGEEFGLCSFHNILPTLDALNELASFLIEMARMYGDPVYVARGVQKGTLEKGMVSEAGRPVSTVWYVPVPDGGIEVLEWRADAMTPTLAFLDRIHDGLREAFPELVLGLLKAGANESGYSVRLRLAELERKVSEMRSNYFAGLTQANNLALKMLGFDSPPSHRIVAEPVLPADEEAQQRMLISDVKDLRIKSRATAARERGIEDVASELAAVDAESPTL